MRFPILVFGLCTLFVVSTAATEEQSTPFWDMIPIIAQGKSLVQLIFGDKDGALKTQKHFLNEGLVSSQLRSAYFLVTGEPKTAWNIQKTFFSNLEGVVDGTPIVGHVKGGIHLLKGAHERGWSAIKSATSTTGAIVGGILGGPAGAIGGHVLTDAIISGTDAILNGNQSQPHGLVDYVHNIDKLKPGEHFDVLAGLLLDARGGKKVQNKDNLFNIGKVDRKESVNSHELVPLLKNEKSENQRAVGMPKKLDSITEETEEPQPGPSRATEFRRPMSRFQDSNSLKFRNFNTFLHNSQTCQEFGLISTGVASTLHYDADLVLKNQHNYYLDKLDVIALRNKLDYLTDNEKSLINENNFRTVNSNFIKQKSMLCSLAGIMNKNIDDVKNLIFGNLDVYDPAIRLDPESCLKSLEDRNFLRYMQSERLNTLDDVKKYLYTNAREFKNKHFILHYVLSEERSHTVVLKFKMLPGNPDPVMLFVDYEYPALIRSDYPNPLRFQSFVLTEYYNYYYISTIQLL